MFYNREDEQVDESKCVICVAIAIAILIALAEMSLLPGIFFIRHLFSSSFPFIINRHSSSTFQVCESSCPCQSYPMCPSMPSCPERLISHLVPLFFFRLFILAAQSRLSRHPASLVVSLLLTISMYGTCVLPRVDTGRTRRRRCPCGRG